MFLRKESKSKFYQIIYFVDGKRTKKSTKKTSLEEAQKVLEDFKNNFGTNIPNLPVENNNAFANIVLCSFKEEYITYCKKNRAKSYIKRSIEPAFKFFLDFVGDVTLNEIRVRNIDQFISSTEERSKSSAALYYRTLKAAFSKAVVWEYISDNPFKKVKPSKGVKKFPAFINEAELIKTCNTTDSQLLKNIFTTAFYTGMRLGELINMRWNWIDFSQNIITVTNSEDFTTKNNKERVIPIHPQVKAILQGLYPIGKESGKDFVFYKCTGKKLNGDEVSKQFKKCVIAAELNEKIHFHSLRHSFASALVQRGVSLYTVKELLGHEDIKTTEIYSHLINENLSQAVNLL